MSKEPKNVLTTAATSWLPLLGATAMGLAACGGRKDLAKLKSILESA